MLLKVSIGAEIPSIPTEILAAVSSSTYGVQNEILKNLNALNQALSSEIGSVVSTVGKIEASIRSAVNDLTLSLTQINDPQLTTVFNELNITFQRYVSEFHGVFEGLIAQVKNDQASIQEKINLRTAIGLKKINSGTEVVTKWVSENITKNDLAKLPGCMRSFAPIVSSIPKKFGSSLSSCLPKVSMQNRAQIAHFELQNFSYSIDSCLKSVGINRSTGINTLQNEDKVVLGKCLKIVVENSLAKLKSFISVVNNIRSIASATISSAQNCFR